MRAVCEESPAPPSVAVLAPLGDLSATELAELRRSSPARLARRFRPEIDAIVARALEKDPERRYQAAKRFVAGAVGERLTTVPSEIPPAVVDSEHGE